MDSLSYTPRVGICLVDRRVGGLSYTPRARSCLVKDWWGVSLYDGICVFVRPRRSAGGEFLLHAPLLEPVLSFVGRGVYLTRPVLLSVLG